MAADNRIVNITLDEKSVVRRSPQIEHERKVAIFDLLDDNEFGLVETADGDAGPYSLHLRIEENRLIFDVRRPDETTLSAISVPTSAFRKTIKDYFMICDSYFEAIKSKAPSQIEAIDMARRGLHNEGAELLKDRMADQAQMDRATARRLFTLVCVLHIRG